MAAEQNAAATRLSRKRKVAEAEMAAADNFASKHKGRILASGIAESLTGKLAMCCEQLYSAQASLLLLSQPSGVCLPLRIRLLCLLTCGSMPCYVE